MLVSVLVLKLQRERLTEALCMKILQQNLFVFNRLAGLSWKKPGHFREPAKILFKSHLAHKLAGFAEIFPAPHIGGQENGTFGF